MRIAYLIDYDLTQNSGVVEKIKQQFAAWKNQGHMVYLVSLKRLTIHDTDKNILFSKKILDIKLGKIGTAIKLLYNSHSVNSLLTNIEIDCIYMRYQMYTPYLSRILKNYKVIMEINSDDTLEYKLHSKTTHFYNLFTRNLILKHINGFICVSHELRKKFQYLHKPISVIANGIDTKKYIPEKHKNELPILVFIGTPNQSWHGLNKILKIAEYFGDYQFYIIGTSGENTNNVKFFGYLSQSEATKIIQKCDIGIGTLSLYKKGLTEASPLKTRQYLACGLPIIYAYQDTDLIDKCSFALQLPNKENNIDYVQIEKFVKNVFNHEPIALEARMFAEKFLEYSMKEKKKT